ATTRREDPRQHREDYAHDAADDDGPDLHRPQRPEPFRERDSDSAPRLRRRRGKLVRAQGGGIGHEQPEAQYADERAHKDAGELGDELFPRMRAEKIATLEVGEEIGAASRRGGGDSGAHEI